MAVKNEAENLPQSSAHNSHTPGPWTLGVSSDHGIHCVDGKNSRGRTIEICEVWGIDEELEETDASRANARLIAAAPEMLEALTELVEHYVHAGKYYGPQWDAAVAAIRKAEGRR